MYGPAPFFFFLSQSLLLNPCYSCIAYHPTAEDIRFQTLISCIHPYLVSYQGASLGLPRR